MSKRGRDDAHGPEAHDPDDWFAQFEREALGEPPAMDASLAGGPGRAAEPPPAPQPFETASLGEVAPDGTDAPPWDPGRTEALPSFWEPEEPPPLVPPPVVQPSPPPQPSFLPPSEPPLPPVDGALPGPAEPTDALDSLFGDSAFREYQGLVDPSQSPFAARSRTTAPAVGGELVRVPAGPPPRGPRTWLRALLWAGGGILAGLALVALFLLGTRLPDLLGPSPAVAPTPSSSPSPSLLPVEPVPPGEYAWYELRGGECLEPYVDAWQNRYTVVDCGFPHAAQMVFRGEFDPEAFPVYPGPEELELQTGSLCSAPGILDLTALGQYTDVVVQGSYPATPQQWGEGASYWCFVSRSSGEPLEGDAWVPPPAEVEEER